jgi:hypothetical protein
LPPGSITHTSPLLNPSGFVGGGEGGKGPGILQL